MIIHITAVGICIAFTLGFAICLILNAYVESQKPYLSETRRWSAVTLNAVLGVALFFAGWLAR